MSEMVPDGWEIKALGNISDVFFSNVDKKSHPDEVPVLLCNYMDVYKNSYIRSGLEFMQATAQQREIDKFTLKQGDVIITKDSETPDDIAVATYVSEELNNVLCGYHLALIRANRKLLHGDYLAHLFGLDEIQHYYYQLANGSTRFGLTTDAILDSRISLPPLPEQQKIASILTSVDTVIEKTKEQISKLKDLKKAMMQELLTKGIGHTEFKDSPIGRIPVSWDVKSLGDISIVKRGASPRPIKDPKWWGGNTGWVRISNVTKSGKYLNETTNYLSEAGVKQSVRMNIGDVIMSICATIGRPIIVNTDVCIHDGFVWFDKLSDEINKEYLYYLLSTKEEYLSQQRQTGTQGNLNTSIVSRLEIAIPPLQEQLKLLSIFNCLDSNVDEKQRKLSHTKSLKKALMQDLLTGKVRVKI